MYAYLKESRGIIHIGANEGQERDLYHSLNIPVLWIEPLDSAFSILQERIKDYPLQKALNYLISDEHDKEYLFGIANNHGQSSSIFPLGLHEEFWPEIHYEDYKPMKAYRMDRLIQTDVIRLSDYDTLILDVQGAELKVLNGFGKFLNHFKYIQCETSDFEVYTGGQVLNDLNDFFKANNYKQKELITCGTKEIGSVYEVIYERMDVMTESSFKDFFSAIKLFNYTSQYGEDGIIESIFNKIGTENKWCMECGAADGIFFSNTRKLIQEGWKSVQIEADSDFFSKLRELYADNDNVHCINTCVGFKENRIDDILKELDVPKDLDLMVIDVDGQDYHIWNSIIEYQPRLLVIEYDKRVTDRFIPEPIEGIYKHTVGQAGIKALTWMAATKGYRPVCATDTNLFCLRKDIADHYFKKEEIEKPIYNGNGLKPNEVEYKGLTYSKSSASTVIEVEDTTTGNKEKLRVAAVTSTPRQGFTAHTRLLHSSMAKFGIPVKFGGGMWWEQVLQCCLEDMIPDADIIITIDYDTMFFPDDVRKLLLLAVKYPEVDVIVPWQLKRGNHNQSLFGMRNENGEAMSILHPSLFMTDMNKIDVGHFGLTLFRTRVFENLPKPWFLNVPNSKGEWREGKTNADIYFWKLLSEQNKKVYVANSIRLGHLDEMVLSLDNNFQIKKQTVQDFLFNNGDNYGD